MPCANDENDVAKIIDSVHEEFLLQFECGAGAVQMHGNVLYAFELSTNCFVD